jgi:hypothetical protein
VLFRRKMGKTVRLVLTALSTRWVFRRLIRLGD